MRSTITSLAKQGKPFWVIASFMAIALIGMIDYFTGYEISLSLFYLIPIAAIAWFVGVGPGIWASAVSTLVWVAGDIAAEQVYFYTFIYAWNALMALGLYICVVLLISLLKKAILREQALNRTDKTTGAANSHCFWDLAQLELDRSSRYKRPLTIAYLDLDHLKTINKKLGYSEGDAVLRTVVGICKKYLRTTDLVARLGDDEFALLLPETPQEGAEIAMTALQLALVEEMQQNNWPITFSIGVLICASVPRTVEETIEVADSLIYSAKKGGKNTICYATYIG
jgi:diguanylate cyclase (GGDEF)-like protein